MMRMTSSVCVCDIWVMMSITMMLIWISDDHGDVDGDDDGDDEDDEPGQDSDIEAQALDTKPQIPDRRNRDPSYTIVIILLIILMISIMVIITARIYIIILIINVHLNDDQNDSPHSPSASGGI